MLRNFATTSARSQSIPRTFQHYFSTATRGSNSSSLKKLIQPFVMKCHPDRAVQQGLPKTAVSVNLKAIQSLNAYVDGAIKMEKGSATYPFSNDEQFVEIEFVMSFDHSATSPATPKAGQQPTTSRRRVELKVPSQNLPTSRVSSVVQKQVVKLLRMADLPIPKLDLDPDSGYEDGRDSGLSGADDLDEEWLAGQMFNENGRGRAKTAWDRSRERFLSRINWNKFDKVYDQALKDAQANLMTQGMVRNNPKLRKQLLARIMSNIHFREVVQPLERLVAYRRLLRLLDEQFDELGLEDFGQYWEEVQIVVTESRPYNTSSSALRKRRQRHLETGYRFTIHHDNSVTVQIPVDFREDELVQELYRNVSDFYEWTHQDITGLEGILEDA
eukprot:Nitzschia sp. Nitz4//scaffold79_size90958//20183//21340//NITZ4_005013-RA/size90958-processed-gene-0.5-mRNA-1//1//CDS//3329558213//8626//frame0